MYLEVSSIFWILKQVQAVLLLLGGRDIPTGVPTIEVPYDQSNRVINANVEIIQRIQLSLGFMFIWDLPYSAIFYRVWLTPLSAQIFLEEQPPLLGLEKNGRRDVLTRKLGTAYGKRWHRGKQFYFKIFPVNVFKFNSLMRL